MQEFVHLKAQQYRYRETNDCSVKALAGCFNLSYGKAHRLLKKAGRVNGGGANVLQISNAISKITGESEKQIINEFTASKGSGQTIKGSGMTIGKFCKENPQGTFYVCSCDHAMCIRDGRLICWTADTAQRRRIKFLYKVKG